MLTKQEVERTRSLVVRELDDYGDIAGLKKLSDQAIEAIDLAAENERLKAELAEYAATFSEQNNALSDNIIANATLTAKLDAVKAECLKPIMITSDVFGGGVAAGHNILKQAVLAIIKDGDGQC